MKYLPRRSRHIRSRRGFTLIEILIVVAIIAVLAAILFPAFASARDSARSAACASNLKQIALGMLMYAQDNSGKLPRPSASAARCGWPDPFIRYTRDPRVFSCPNDDQERVYDPACTAAPSAPIKENAGSYTIVATEQVLARHEPSQIVLVLDGRGQFNGVGSNVGDKLTVVPKEIPAYLGPPRHRDGYNAVFGDGHVKHLTPEKMVDPVLWGYRR